LIIRVLFWDENVLMEVRILEEGLRRWTGFLGWVCVWYRLDWAYIDMFYWMISILV